MRSLTTAVVFGVLAILGGLVATGCTGGGHHGTTTSNGTIGSGGGTVSANGATVTVPPGALSQSTTITIDPGTRVASGANAEAGSAFTLGPQGTTFAAPVTVTIPYDAAKLQAAGKTTSDIYLLHRNDSTGTITKVTPTSVDTAQSLVTFQVSSFSTVQAAVAATVDPAQSTVVVSPSSVLADGSSPATIQVVVKNKSGEAFPGLTVVLAASGSGNTLTQPSAPTDSQGKASGTLVSTGAETKTVTASAGAVTLNSQPTVSFTATGVPSVRITTPLALEKVPTGVTLNIAWTSANTTENVNLSVSTDSGATYTTIASGLANNSSTTWTPPGGTTKARLKLVTASGSASDSQTADFTFVKVWFVDSAAPGLADGLTWQTAIHTIQAAVDLATAGEQVWVAHSSSYTGGTSDGVVIAKSGVDLRGGFQGGETALSARPQPLVQTTIDGQNARRAVMASCGGTVRLDGFRFFHGVAPEGGSGLFGAETTLEISSCVFESNQSTNGKGGGALLEMCPSVTVSSCTFKLNTAGGEGGGLLVTTGPSTASTLTVTQTTFDQNSSTSEAGGGAAILVSDSSLNTNATVSFSGCAFSQNLTSNDGGGLYARCCVATLDNDTFTSNTATRNGGGIALLFARPQISRTTFTSNVANGSGPAPEGIVFGGGGLSLEQTFAGSVKQCSFLSNTSSAGAGVNVKGPIGAANAPLFQNCLFAGNTSSSEGGGSFVGATANATFDFCTFTNNTATAHGRGFGIMDTCQGTITNSIVFGNTGGTGADISAFDESLGVTVNTSDVSPANFPGTGNLSADPLFVNPATNDYHLKAGSPCIGAANPTGAPAQDRDQLSRDATPDMGAFEKH